MTKQLFALLAACMPVVALAQDQQATPQWRPVYHFTPAKNWTNDPNGLIYLNGEYHLYYQHNPYENKWGHMSWGHATSKDLLNWKHLPVAIPEIETKDTTTWIFSGCAVLDSKNTSGFGTGGKAPLVAVYTADLPKQQRETQCLAYSNDGGTTFTQYAGNPVIDIQKKDFRDPSVIWMEEQQQWVMTVAVPAEHKLQFYASKNLKEWTLLSEFGDQGDVRKIWECPSLTPLYVDGDPGKKKWLLMISSGNQDAATGMQYFTGDFDGKTFTNDNKPEHQQFVDYGRTFYAAIPYNNLPDGRQTMLGWLMPFDTPTHPWRGQMSIPRDLFLKSTSEGVRLYQQPSGVLAEKLAALPASARLAMQQTSLRSNELQLTKGNRFNANTNWIDAVFTPGTATDFGFKLTQDKTAKRETILGYNVSRNELYVATVEEGKAPVITDKLTVKPVAGKISLQVLLDKSSLEVFVNGGEKVLTTLLFPSEKATGLAAFAKDGDVKIETLKAWDLHK
ncbi:glycoside hydrolase family 32 protein [Chitinophaga rhizophila]|uniref:Glycoside hydrolase family 32 protein n=1 Tax=Chitinophaga rhizophila TaxID=2866212 RepID=A0ABS7GKX2_9BACT|nr:glycoside hydrolase family 32 protein [Chitinophaga rhizophila]MBW8687770.1 glycoside hydrolase family 32 protein [Chitinophaga rhizophila]